MSRSSPVLRGQGLHSGRPSSVRFLESEGPARLRSRSADVPIGELEVVSAERSTSIGDARGTLRIGTVEHLFAALGSMGVRSGLVVEIEGDEVPLVDGGARAFMDALATLGLASEPPALRVAREGAIEIAGSRYEFRPGEAIEVEVEVDYDDPRLARAARWGGDVDDFRERISVARTFGFAHEVEQLIARGLASHVLPESVVVVAHDRVLFAGRPFTADEPARHKLLDLVGDLYLHGGPPRGHVRAARPGHAATHAAIAKALADGLLAAARTG